MMRRAAIVASALAYAAPAMADDADYGRFLAGECAACHAAGGEAATLEGAARVDFIAAMAAFRGGSGDLRMQDIVRSLDERDVAALADYFSGASPGE